MTELSTKLKLYTKANGVNSVDFEKDIILQDNSNGKGAYIKEWNLDIAEPTEEQLATYESAATTDENNNVVIANRKSEYGSNTYQIENIIENGLEAEQTRVQAIKDKYPKE
jgi:hypothetical protein|tara:strand:- start:664 stop:996 length:333 start_codon:yes stop_codon:yes gene_type:complete